MGWKFKMKIIFLKSDDRKVKIKIRTQQIKNVNEFKYSRVLKHNNGRHQKEMKAWIGKEKNVVKNHSKMFRNRNMTEWTAEKKDNVMLYVILEILEIWRIQWVCKIISFLVWQWHINILDFFFF